MFGKLVLIERIYILLVLITILSVVNPVQALLKEGNVDRLSSDTSEPLYPPSELLDAPDTIPFENNFSPESGWDNLLYENSKTISRSYDQPLDLGFSGENGNAISETSRLFAQSWLNESGLENITLNILSIRQALNWTLIYIQPEISRVPVYDSFLILSINDKGEITALKAQGFGSETVGEFSLTLDQARSIAKKAFTASFRDCVVRPVYIPFETQSNTIHLRSTYEIEITTPDPVLQPTLYLDGDSGEIFAAENRVDIPQMKDKMRGWYSPLNSTDDCDLGEFNYDYLEAKTDDPHNSGEIGSFVTEIFPEKGKNIDNNNNFHLQLPPPDDLLRPLNNEPDDFNHLNSDEYYLNGENLGDALMHFNDREKDINHAKRSILSNNMLNSSANPGRTYCDSLFHLVQFHHARDMRTYFQDVLNVTSIDGDIPDNLANYQVLFDRFQKSGINLGEYPHFNFRRLPTRVDTVDCTIGGNESDWEPDGTISEGPEYFKTGTDIPLRELMLGPYTRRILRALRLMGQE